jgi:ketosteroid isomerase-like protein
MGEVSAFLAAVIPQLEAEVIAIHNGDAEPRLALWSHHDPVTLFGAEMTRSGWEQLEPAFQQLAESFSGSESFQYEVIAAGVSGDLGYVAGIERSVAARRGAEPVQYALRVTTIFRREDGAWKVVHRHGDRYDEASRTRSP